MHGRIWEENGLYWVEDLNSFRGTQLNGVEIKGRGKRSSIRRHWPLAGQTTLRIELSDSRRVLFPNQLPSNTAFSPTSNKPTPGPA